MLLFSADQFIYIIKFDSGGLCPEDQLITLKIMFQLGILDQRNYSFCQQGFPSFEVYLITLYLSHVCLRLLSFPVCTDWPNSDS